MDDIKNAELTEELKYTECEINERNAELRAVRSKLYQNYKYEAEMLERLEKARNKTKDLHQELSDKIKAVAVLHDKMKNILDVFTGNFFNQ